MNEKEPKHHLKLLRLFCKEEYLEEIEGDLLEKYEQHGSKFQLLLEIFKLIRIRLLRSFIDSHQSATPSMIKHNIKASIRSFGKNKTSFLVNYIGLVGGLVTVLFIYLWVNHELQVDRFHKNSDLIYRLVGGSANTQTILNTNPYNAWELEASIPEIDYVVNSCWGSLFSYLSKEEEAFATRGEFGSQKFFTLFSYPLLSGDATTVFEQPNAIVLSESMAIKLFGTTDVLGEQLVWRWYSHEEPVVVSGVFEELPKSSSEQFDYVLNFEIYEKRYGNRLKRGRQARTFLKLKEGSSPGIVNQKILDYTRATYPAYEGAPMRIIPYADYYLEGQFENGKPVGGRIELVRLFTAIGILVLLLACINFMNLSTARAALRAKEIGVRKAMGALRKSLISQYLTESCIIAILAGLTSCVLFYLLLPLFERLLAQPIQVNPYPVTILGFLGIVLFTGLLSGSYPALYLSGLSPLKVLKGSFAASSKDQWLRKGLVVFQFGFSLLLIVSVLVIYEQMRFIQTKELGYQNDYIINFRTTGMTASQQKAFLDEVRRAPGVLGASGISHALFGAQRSASNMSWQGKDPEEEVWFDYGHVGYGMLELLEIKPNEGRFFSTAFGNETSKVVVNKATKDLMGVENAIGKKFTVGGDSYEIIGVTENFHFQSLHEEIKPTFFLLNPNDWYLRLAIKIAPGNVNNTLDKIDHIFSEMNPDLPFQYAFHDQEQAEMYKSEIKISLLTNYAAGLAILISSLGLFGLVSFMVEQKSKEMGIRKVLGASTRAVFTTITKGFFLPIAFASLFGITASAILTKKWLAGFAYRIELKWWFFALGVFILLFITLLTSLPQIRKALRANPIDALRDE